MTEKKLSFLTNLTIRRILVKSQSLQIEYFDDNGREMKNQKTLASFFGGIFLIPNSKKALSTMHSLIF